MEQQNSMPGPQFQDYDEKNWFKKHSRNIVIALIVILVATGAFYFYKNYQQRKSSLKPALDNWAEITADKKEPQATQTPAPANKQIETKNAQTTDQKIKVPENKKENDGITVKAVKGNGKTHLAREALKSYLEGKNDLKLNIEQKIYIEDYLQKQSSNKKSINTGDEISFSNQLIKDSIDKALKLNENQIKNLHKYVHLVPSLNY